MALLRYVTDSGQIEQAKLGSEPFLIGRAASCQITLVSDMVSREHVRIERESDGRYRICDLGSRNKTYVNGQAIGETLLSAGDVVRVGEHVLEYVDDGMVRERIDLKFLTPDRHEPPDTEWVKIKAPVSLTIQQIEQLSRLSSDSGLTVRPEDIADAALGQLILDLQGERGFVALRGESKRDLRPVAHRGLKLVAGESLLPVSQSFVYAALLQFVAGRYPQTAGQIKKDQGYAATAVVAPLTFHGDVVGIVYVDRPEAKKPFGTTAIPHIAAAGAHLGAQMAEASRKLVHSASHAMSAWMTTVRRMQDALMVEPTSSEAFDVAVKHYRGRARCGDFCDVIHLDEQRCAVVVVDGGGHGTAGLAQAAAVRASVRAALAVSDEALMDPAALITSISRMVSGSGGRQVVPCTYLGIDLASGKVAYVNAGGMPPLLMVAPGRLVTLDQSALVLGVDPEYIYEVARADLPEVFRVVIHTDGIIEATNAAGEALGEQRFHDTLLDREAFPGVENVVEKVHATWTMHLAGAESDDDGLVVVIGRG